MKNRKIFLALASVLLLAVIFAVAAMAETQSGQVAPKTLGDTLTWTLDTETGELLVEGTATEIAFDKNAEGKGVNWNNMDVVPWYAYGNSIKSAKVTAQVTKISQYSFAYLTNLEKVVLPTSLKNWDGGYNYFGSCSKLHSVAFGTEYGDDNVIDLSNLTDGTKGGGQTFEAAGNGKTLTVLTPKNGAPVLMVSKFFGKAAKVTVYVKEGSEMEKLVDQFIAKADGKDYCANIEKAYYDLDWAPVDTTEGTTSTLVWALDGDTLYIKGDDEKLVFSVMPNWGKNWAIDTSGEPWNDSKNEIKNIVFRTPNLKSIPTLTFAKYTALENVTIPESLTTFGNGVFHSDKKLKSITVDGNDVVEGVIDLRNITSCGGELLEQALAGIDYKIYTMDSTSATSISSGALKGSCGATSVEIFVTKNSTNETNALKIKEAGVCKNVTVTYYEGGDVDPDHDPIQETKTAEAPYGTPVLDGKIDEIWNTAKAIDFPWDRQNCTRDNLAKEMVYADPAKAPYAKMLWDENNLYVLAVVYDDNLNVDKSISLYNRDGIEIYVDETNQKALTKAEATAYHQLQVALDGSDVALDGATAEVKTDKLDDNTYVIEVKYTFKKATPKEGAVLGFDVSVNCNETGANARAHCLSWNDRTNETYMAPCFTGNLKLVAAQAPIQETKTAEAEYGTPTIDGTIDEIWEKAKAIDFPWDRQNCTRDNLAKEMVYADPAKAPYAKMLWDENNLYVLAVVYDDNLNVDKSISNYNRDGVEIYIDEKNQKAETIAETEVYRQLRVILDGSEVNKDGATVEAATGKLGDNVYVVEVKYTFSGITPEKDTVIGFDVSVNCNETGENVRAHSLSWNDRTNETWMAPCFIGNLKLTKTETIDPDPKPEPDPEPEDEIVVGTIVSQYVNSTWEYNKATKVITITPSIEAGWNETGSWKLVKSEDPEVDWNVIIKEATEVVVKNGETSKMFIGKVTAGAFSGASNLVKITVPSSCSQINENAFNGCTKLTTFVHSGNTEINGVFDAGIFSNPSAGFSRNNAKYFEGGESVKKLIINSVYSDENPVLKVNLPSSLEEIWGSTEYLENFCKENGYKFVSFTRLSKTSYITIDGDTLTLVANGDEITKIDVSKVLGAENVKKIVVESTVAKIADNAFADFANLESAEFTGFAPEAGENIFGARDDSFVITVKPDCGFGTDKWKGYNISIKSAEKVLYGDANGDGVINAKDAIAIAQYLAGWTVENFNVKAADVTKDGKITAADTVLLTQYLAGWEDAIAIFDTLNPTKPL